jgi:hypothetical protein
MELQDLAPSDGLFKIFILPGDILEPADKSRLEKFCQALTNSIVSSLTERIRIYTILSSAKEKAIWSDVPAIARDWKKSVYFPSAGRVSHRFFFPSAYLLAKRGPSIRISSSRARAPRSWSGPTDTSPF